jgi:two-component system chemotaxis sensor kinase CheA
VRFAHTFETTLDQIRSGSLSPTPEAMATLLRAADILADLVAAAREGEPIDEAAWLPMLDQFRALDASGEPPDDETEALDFLPTMVSLDDLEAVDTASNPPLRIYSIAFNPRRELYASANDAALLLRELGRLGAMKPVCNMSALPLLDELDPDGAYFSWTIELAAQCEEAAVREIFEFVVDACDLTIECRADGLETVTGEESAPEDSGALIDRGADSSSYNASAAPSEFTASRRDSAAFSPHEGRDSPPDHEAAKTEATPAPTTIRVDFERVDRLINLVGELVTNQAMLSQRIVEAGLAGASTVKVGLDELDQLTREIQEGVMAIRAQPVKSLFQRMSRIVRETCAATSKTARLRTEGDGTEIDKTVVERLADPLTHLIRNAVDHGLEASHLRVAAGKPAEGTVRISAVHRSGRVIIEVADDGAGIDRERVKDVAVRKGLLSADAQPTDSEIDNLIFLPGFSTVSKLSSISGRGVGMDVVKRSIQALGGRVSIESWPGKGSTFSMSLPLTLAVLDGMVVTTRGQTLVVPLTAIVETLRPEPGDIHAMGEGAAVLAIRGGFVPVIDVGELLGFRETRADPPSRVAILIETDGGARNALLVESIQDQRQVVIKSLEANYQHVPDIAAATILGDGRVALILDADSLVARIRGESAPQLLHLMKAS